MAVDPTPFIVPVDTNETAAPSKPLVATPLGILDLTKIPCRRWLLGTTLIRGHVKVLIATGGIGKTQLILQRAISIVTGRNLSGGKVHERGRAWVINGEDLTEELDRRIAAICQQWSIDPRDLGEDLFRNSGFDRRLIVAEERDGQLVATPDVDALIKEIQRKDILYLGVDPFVRAHRVRENSNEAIDFAAEQFALVAAETGCAIEVAHHSRKPPLASSESLAGNADSARGASALVNAARIVDTLYPMSEKDSARFDIPKEERRLYLRADAAKANMALIQDGPTWFKRTTVVLSNGPGGTDGDRVGVLVQVDLSDAERRAKDKEQEQREKMAEKVATVLQPGKPLSLNQIAQRLIEEDLAVKAPSTVRRHIEDAIPQSPASITVEIEGISVRLYRSRRAEGSKDPILVTRENRE